MRKMTNIPSVVVLWVKNSNNFGKISETIKREFNLKEANETTFPGRELSRALVLPNPEKPDEDYIYRIRFNPWYLQGPVIDFKYREELPKKILEEDLRKSAIIRVSQLTEVIKIT